MSSPTANATLPVLVLLPSDLARTINTLAKQRGQDHAGFIVQLLREQLAKPTVSFEEGMAPISADFERSGISEEDLDTLVEDERQAMWNEKRPAG